MVQIYVKHAFTASSAHKYGPIQLKCGRIYTEALSIGLD